MIYGTPAYHIDDDQTDRIGIRTLIVSRIWQASQWPLSSLELDAEKPPIPEVSGGVILIGAQTRRIGGGFRTSWTFEGINGDGNSVTFKTRANSIDFRFEPGFSQVSITKLRKFPALAEKYGGYVLDGQVIWPQTIPGTTGAGLSGGKKTEGDPNPLFGHDDYFRVEGTYSFRYAARNAPTGGGVGKIHKSGDLPGKAPAIAGRDWLKLPPASIRRGPVYDITESYWLSGEGGWPVQIYDSASGGETGAAQLTKNDLAEGADAAPPVRLAGASL